MPQQVIFVDIDDTMVRSVGVKRMPMPAVIEQVRRLKAEGTTLYLWSSGGAEYCMTTAVELGITDCFEGCPSPRCTLTTSPSMSGGFASIFIRHRPRMFNIPIESGPQQQKAASPPGVVARSSLR